MILIEFSALLIKYAIIFTLVPILIKFVLKRATSAYAVTDDIVELFKKIKDEKKLIATLKKYDNIDAGLFVVLWIILLFSSLFFGTYVLDKPPVQAILNGLSSFLIIPVYIIGFGALLICPMGFAYFLSKEIIRLALKIKNPEIDFAIYNFFSNDRLPKNKFRLAEDDDINTEIKDESYISLSDEFKIDPVKFNEKLAYNCSVVYIVAIAILFIILAYLKFKQLT